MKHNLRGIFLRLIFCLLPLVILLKLQVFPVFASDSDTTEISKLLQKGRECENSEPEKAYGFYLDALTKAEKINDKKFVSKSMGNLGYCCAMMGNYPKSLEYLEKALEIRKALGDINGMATCYSNIGNIYTDMGKYAKAVSFFDMALDIYTRSGDSLLKAGALLNLGLTYYDQGIFLKSAGYFQRSLKIFESAGNKQGMSKCYNNIGNIQSSQGNYRKAIEYFNMSLKLKTELNDKIGISRSLSSIGVAYSDLMMQDSALIYYLKGLKIVTELGMKKQIFNITSNIGVLYKQTGDYPRAMEYYHTALKIGEETGNTKGVSVVLGNMAGINNQLGQYNEAVAFAGKSLKIAIEIGSLEDQKRAYDRLSFAYKGMCDYKKAMEYHELYFIMYDSIFNIEKNNQIEKLEAVYQSEKKQKEIELKTSQLDKKNIEVKQQKTVIIAFIAGLSLMLVLIVVVLKSYRRKRKDNMLLTEQKHEIEEKNEELNQQNEEIRTQRDNLEQLNDELTAKNEEIMQQKEEITAQRDEIEIQRDLVVTQKKHIEIIHLEVSQSIDYAKRIQTSILPDVDLLNEKFDQHFILFKPKDKVSGDFYWFALVEGQVVIAVADCTGHGVPGAFMSMLGTSFLREIVQKEYITNPAIILRRLRKEIIRALKQKGESGEQKDGMDMAIVSINPETNLMQFAGANNPCWIVETCQGMPQQLTELRPDKMPIGIHDKMDSFTVQDYQLQKSDTIYLMSDGYEDQFGGPRGKKFLSKNLKQLLTVNCQKPMAVQNEILEKTIENWKNAYAEKCDQTDDITVLGIKI